MAISMFWVKTICEVNNSFFATQQISMIQKLTHPMSLRI